ncbi:MAG: hypothetical protein AB2417_10965 [Clostridiaceae bacterium]
MNILKKTTVKGLLLCLVLSILVTGCSEYNDPKNNVPTKGEEITYENTDKYKKELASNISVDAKVSIPKEKSIPILSVSGMKFNVEKARQLFMEDINVKVEKRTDTVGSEKVEETIYNTEDGRNLRVSKGRMHYRTPASESIANILNFVDKDSWEAEKVGFMTPEEAIKKAIYYLKELNINYDSSPEIYALDYKTFQEQQDRLLEEDDFSQFLVDEGKIKLKNWSKEDEVYYMIFKSNIDGVPITSESYTLQSVDWHMEGSSIKIIVSKNGIEDFSIESYMYEKMSVKDEDPSLISIDEALDKLKSKYDNVISNDDFKVTDIKLQYVPTIIKNKRTEFELYPTWCFKVEQSGIDEKINEEFTHTFTVLINGVTGEEII